MFVEVSADRYEAHRDLERRFRNETGTRQYLWRMMGQTALVVPHGEEYDILGQGEEVEFMIDTIPSRCIGKREGREQKRWYVTEPREQREWFGTMMFNNAGLLVTQMRVTPLNTHIKDFFKPGYRFVGKATVMQPDLLNEAQKKGIGQGKAYGFGLLVIQ